MGRPLGAKGKKPRKDKSPIPLMQRKSVVCKRYEKTRKGLLMRTYRNMKSRVLGIQHKKAHLYQGLELLSKQEFYEWSLSDTEYNSLFDTWVSAEYNRKLTPSIDRIDSSRGYNKENMRWVTHSENSRQGSVSQWNQKRLLSRTFTTT